MMTLEQRCKLATDCLPQAEYRTRLEALHAELLAGCKDAERYRWLRDKGSNTWVPFTGQWKIDAEHCDAAIDNEMANQRLFGAA